MAEWVLSREPTPICNPMCRLFRCEKKVLDLSRETPWCQWVNAPCIGYHCPYASCIQMKLLPDGKCALFVKRRTVEETRSPEEVIRAELASKAKKKLEKFGE